MSDWMDSFLEVGSYGDWISPVFGIFENTAGGKTDLAVHVGCGRTDDEIRQALQSAGVQVGAGCQIVNDHYMLPVDDLDRAVEVLGRHGLDAY